MALRPHPADPGALIETVERLGVRNLLLRLHPWEEGHEAEAALARELHARGFDLTFALPQNRELVRDPERWRAAVTRLGESFLPYGGRFQLGQAINRSKWGVWNHREYLELAISAGRIDSRSKNFTMSTKKFLFFWAVAPRIVSNVSLIIRKSEYDVKISRRKLKRLKIS